MSVAKRLFNLNGHAAWNPAPEHGFRIKRRVQAVRFMPDDGTDGITVTPVRWIGYHEPGHDDESKAMEAGLRRGMDCRICFSGTDRRAR